MLKKYTIREGFTFVMENGEVKGGGETVDLPPDVAAQHLHKLEGEPEPEAELKAGGKVLSKAGTDLG